MDVDQMRRLRRLLEIADDDEDDEPDILAGVRKKQLHDIVNRQGQLIQALGPVRTITMERDVNGYIVVSFIYDSPGPCGDQPMMDEFSIKVSADDYGHIDVLPRFRNPDDLDDRPSNKALARWLNLATGMPWDGAGLVFVDWNHDDNPWYSYGGSPRERYMEIVDVITQPEAQQLFTWSNDHTVVFNR